MQEETRLVRRSGRARRSDHADPSSSEPPLRPFSSERAWRQLEALTAIGPRPAGSEGSRQARTLLRGALGVMHAGVTNVMVLCWVLLAAAKILGVLLGVDKLAALA